jgi:hypothetical protein
MLSSIDQYEQILSTSKVLFLKKAKDYGTAWTILRMPSLTDQIGIKADRIRSLQEKQVNLVGDSIEDEFVGIINYCLIALMLLDLRNKQLHNEASPYPSTEALERAYDQAASQARETFLKKNHDYGEAWRKMRVSSITDLILMKILRLKQIEDNDGTTLVSEGPDANYIDMLNYAVFSLILLAQESGNN